MNEQRSHRVKWVGQSIVRIGNKTIYSKFKYGKLKGETGSFFRISCEEHKGKPGQLVQIVQLYEAHDVEEEKHWATVRKFVDCRALPKNITNYRGVKPKLYNKAEVLLDAMDEFDTDISIKSFITRCEVKFGKIKDSPAEVTQNQRNVFICRYKVVLHDGKQQIEPYFTDDSEDEDSAKVDQKLCMKPRVELERVVPLRPNSPRIPSLDPGTKFFGKKLKNDKKIMVKEASTPNAEIVILSDSESEVENRTFNMPLQKLTDEEIISMLTAKDDDEDNDIFSDFENTEDTAPNDAMSEHQSQVKSSTTKSIHSSFAKDSAHISGTPYRQRSTENDESSDENDDGHCAKRIKLDTAKTPTHSPRWLSKQTQQLHKNECSSSVMKQKKTTVSPTKDKPCESKEDMLSIIPKSKLNKGSNTKSPVTQMSSESQYCTPKKSGTSRPLTTTPNRAVLKINDSPESKAPRRSSSRTPVSSKRYKDSWVVTDRKSTPQQQTIMLKEKDEQENTKTSTKVQQSSLGTNSPKTPKSKMGLSAHRALLTPSMPARGSSVQTPRSLLEVVRSRLCVSAVPKSLPCREYELNNIYHFIEGKIIDKGSGCMYVSGVPGTGKTATVQEVLRILQNKAECREIPRFDLVELNGMRMTEPRQAYVQLYRALTKQTVTTDQAQNLLEKRFSSQLKKQETTVVIVDELDMLCTKRQDVVYNLLDWPTKASSRLVVVTIANTMDLPEKLLKGRVTSRLGLTRVTFHPYTFQQLMTIVMERLKGLTAFDPDAIELVARKVAAVSGDARRALDICRRATELAEGKANLVCMQHVDEAVQEMSTSATVRTIRNRSIIEQHFLRAVITKMQCSGLDEVSFQAVHHQMMSICTFNGVKVPSVTEMLKICAALSSARLLILKHSSHDIYQEIMLNVSRDDLHYALRVSAA